jgi:hypothetical protein
MNRLRYTAVATLMLWAAFAPTQANAQGLVGVHDASTAARPLLFPLPQAPLSKQRIDWVTSARLAADGGLSALRGVPAAQSTRNARSERGVGRKLLGAAVGAAGGLFAGGYLGAAIEGDRCHCDDAGLQGALIGAPVGAAAGGILGFLYLF